MAMVIVVLEVPFILTLLAVCVSMFLVQADRLGPNVGGRLALLLHLSNEPGELS